MLGPGPAAELQPRKGSTIQSAEAAHLALQNVTLHTPNYERILVQNLSVMVKPGESLLIVGDSGCGKSSLLRAIAGLWYAGSGSILRPPASEMLFLPQQPYMQFGTLRSQLLYPHKTGTVPDTRLLRVLEQANLPDLAERFGSLDVEMDWEKVLSIGEQQRLAFARVLLFQPRYAILDEATSALDSANEAALRPAARGWHHADQYRPPGRGRPLPHPGAGAHWRHRLAPAPGGGLSLRAISQERLVWQ